MVKIDSTRLKQQVEFQIEAGTTFLCPVGTTGESPTLTHEEQERVISEVVQAAAGRIKVMPGNVEPSLVTNENRLRAQEYPS